MHLLRTPLPHRRRPQGAHAHPHRRETLQLYHVRQTFRQQLHPQLTHQNTHRRTPLHLYNLLEILHTILTLKRAQAQTHRRKSQLQEVQSEIRALLATHSAHAPTQRPATLQMQHL